jgi:hypothetical protein
MISNNSCSIQSAAFNRFTIIIIIISLTSVFPLLKGYHNAIPANSASGTSSSLKSRLVLSSDCQSRNKNLHRCNYFNNHLASYLARQNEITITKNKGMQYRSYESASLGSILHEKTNPSSSPLTNADSRFESQGLTIKFIRQKDKANMLGLCMNCSKQ